ncbi:MAG: RHS repeat-associated core domain-containing protein [Candidatus Komeilibacteria bacterium]|nr:RHS repeat-associated core domain-containing protein [Candidatus Komeilibacteria bacterium]
MRKAIYLFLFFLIPQIAAAYGTDYRFTGKPYDGSSDLYYFNQRYYDPDIGRFTQADPLQNFLVAPWLKQKTGLELEDILANPQRLNSYSYALNNPVNVIDPLGESPHVSEDRQNRFNNISDYIRNDQNYWQARDKDGNEKALDLIWQKSLDLSKNAKGQADVSAALDTFYDAVNIDMAHQKTLDKNYDDYLNRLNNLPTSILGYFGSSNNYIDKLQHFVASARLTYHFGSKIAGLLGRLKEVADGFKALFNQEYGYKQLKDRDEGYSLGDISANRMGIFWMNEYKTGKTNPSTVLYNFFGW